MLAGWQRQAPTCPVPLPACCAVLLDCSQEDGAAQVMAALRQALAARALEGADVDAMDEGGMRALLAQAQTALRGAVPPPA